MRNLFKNIMKIVLAGCIAATPAIAMNGFDNYSFRGGEQMNEQISLQVIVLPNAFALREIAKNKYHFPREEAGHLLAFSVWSPDNNRCKIYIIDPHTLYMPEQYGHELMHCAYGNWHGDYESVNPNSRYKKYFADGSL